MPSLVIRDPAPSLPGNSVAPATAGSPGSESAAHFSKVENVPADTNAALAAKASIVQALVLNPGAALTDASAMVQPTTDLASSYTMPAATLSTNRTTTLGITGPPTTGKLVVMVRRDLSANTWTIANAGTLGGNVFVFAASPTIPVAIAAYFDGVDWVLSGYVQMAAL